MKVTTIVCDNCWNEINNDTCIYGRVDYPYKRFGAKNSVYCDMILSYHIEFHVCSRKCLLSLLRKNVGGKEEYWKNSNDGV